MRAALAFVIALAACYSASPASEVPCSAEGNCPGDQQCDFGRSPPTCVDQLPDAGAPGPDAEAPCVDNSSCPMANAPVCDPDDKVCRGCDADSECASDACSESTGTCIDVQTALFVDPAGTDLGTCTATMPCKTIQFAIDQADAMRSFIKVAEGTYVEALKIQNGPLTISGGDRDPDGEILTSPAGPAVQLDAGSLVLEGLTVGAAPGDGIQSKAPLTVYRVTITQNNNAGIDHSANDNAPLVVRESEITDNNNVGISVQDAPATITRSYIAENTGGGVRANRCALTMLNTMVVQNGTALGSNPGVRIQNVGANPQRFEFNTIAGNLGTPLGAGVICESPVILASSILANNGGGTSQMQGCTAFRSLFSSGAPIGMGNKNGDPAFVDAANGDYHITDASEAIGRGESSPDVVEDFDGDDRSGNELEAGADELD